MLRGLSDLRISTLTKGIDLVGVERVLRDVVSGSFGVVSGFSLLEGFKAEIRVWAKRFSFHQNFFSLMLFSVLSIRGYFSLLAMQMTRMVRRSHSPLTLRYELSAGLDLEVLDFPLRLD